MFDAPAPLLSVLIATDHSDKIYFQNNQAPEPKRLEDLQLENYFSPRFHFS